MTRILLWDLVYTVGERDPLAQGIPRQPTVLLPKIYMSLNLNVPFVSICFVLRSVKGYVNNWPGFINSLRGGFWSFP